MKAITVCVEYDDLLKVLLPRNARHFEQALVVTSPTDLATQMLVLQSKKEGLPVNCYVTNAFYRDGAAFNKGLAIEEGFDRIGRDGWLVVMDADILLPESFDVSDCLPSNLYCPRRRQCDDVTAWNPEDSDWSRYKLLKEQEHAGFFQLFHASDPVLATRPWYGTDWRHAGGCDSDFQAKWAAEHKRWLPFEVLHLGPHGTNWLGRVSPRLDGTLPAESAARQDAMQRMYGDRRKHGFSRERLRAFPTS